MVLFFYELTSRSKLSIAKFGFGFFTGTTWDPVAGDFGALPFVFLGKFLNTLDQNASIPGAVKDADAATWRKAQPEPA